MTFQEGSSGLRDTRDNPQNQNAEGDAQCDDRRTSIAVGAAVSVECQSIDRRHSDQRHFDENLRT
jgi:hypothetical protein